MSQLVRRVALRWCRYWASSRWKPAPVQAGAVIAKPRSRIRHACEPYEAGAYVGLWCS